MEIKLLVFGQVAEVTGMRESTCTDVNDTDGLRKKFSDDFPILLTIQYTVAVNKKVVSGNIVLNDGDTVALLPPFSGG